PRENPRPRRRAQLVEEISPRLPGIAHAATRQSREATPHPEILSPPAQFPALRFSRAKLAGRPVRRIPIRRLRAATPAPRESTQTPLRARRDSFQTPAHPQPAVPAHTLSAAATARAVCQIRVRLVPSATCCFFRYFKIHFRGFISVSSVRARARL